MKGVFGKPYVCLDEYTNINQLVDIIGDINYGVAKSHAFIKPNFAASDQVALDNELIKDSPKRFSSAYQCWLADVDPIRQARGQELLATDRIAFEWWLSYEYKVKEMVTYLVIRDRDTLDIAQYQPCDRLKPNNFQFIWTEASNNFSTLKTWSEQLPFKQLGSIVLLLKKAGVPVPLHTDSFFNSDNYDHQEQFIWFDPVGNRSMYVFDAENNVKHLMANGVSYYWNNHDLHGGINITQSLSWTIRVEGIFEDQMQEELERKYN